MSWTASTPTLISTQIAYGSGSNLLTSSSNFTFDNSTDTLSIGGTNPALISADVGQTMSISSDISVTLETNSLTRLTINQNGSFTIAGSTGTSGQVLTSAGSSTSPTWETPSSLGSPSPATTATTGFGYIPVTTGTPTGVPVAITGYVPMVADSGGDKLWVYIGGTWKYATLT
jgi:hypothetical protein